ncbi:MAG: hypothetical protein QM784_22965 [Polyangiaceae bacterium]
MKPLTLNRLSVNLIATGLVAAILGCSSDENDGTGTSDINGSAGGAVASTERNGSTVGGASVAGTNALGGKAAVGGSVTRGATGGSNPGNNSSSGGASSTTGGNLGGNSTGGVTGSATGGSTGSSTGGSSTGGTSTRVDCGTVATDFSCVTDQDCCLVSNTCHSVLYLANASQRGKVQNCLDAQGVVPCPSCLSAPVQLSCVNRRCIGTVLDRNLTGYSSAFSAPHCGSLPLPTGAGGASSHTTTATTTFATFAPSASGVSAAGGAAAQAPWVRVVGGSAGTSGTAAGGGNAGVPVLSTQATMFTCSSM